MNKRGIEATKQKKSKKELNEEEKEYLNKKKVIREKKLTTHNDLGERMKTSLRLEFWPSISIMA